MASSELEDLIEVEHAGGTIIVHLRRVTPLGSASRGRLQERLTRLAEDSPDRRLWLDFGQIEYADNEALSLVVQLQRSLLARQRKILVVNPRPLVREALAVNRLDR